MKTRSISILRNKGLETKMNLVRKLYDDGDIKGQLDQAKHLIGQFFYQTYAKSPIPYDQLIELQNLVTKIKNEIPKEHPWHPLSQLIYAMYLGRKGGGQKNKELAHEAYAEIHKTYPDYILAYQKHSRFCYVVGEKENGITFGRIAIQLEMKKNKETAKAKLIKKTVGTGRSTMYSTLFAPHPVTDCLIEQSMKLTSTLQGNLTTHLGSK